MPDGPSEISLAGPRRPDEPGAASGPNSAPPETVHPGKKDSAGLRLRDLQSGRPDSIGAMVLVVLFRGRDYAIYRSTRGVYVHFSDDKDVDRSQRSAYVKLSAEICELRYLTSQMRPGALARLIGRAAAPASLYDHNMAQALMLLMESAAQRNAGQTKDADATEDEAKNIAKRALDMAVRRNTSDNTIRYVCICVLFGLVWLLAAAAYLQFCDASETWFYVLASATGIVGAVFSVIVRAQAFELKPCDDSGMNKLMSLVRIGMGGVAGPVLFLLLMTVSASALAGAIDVSKKPSDMHGLASMVAVIGLIGGFAERLVPNLVQGAADKMENRAGTPSQAAEAAKAGIGSPGKPAGEAEKR